MEYMYVCQYAGEIYPIPFNFINHAHTNYESTILIHIGAHNILTSQGGLEQGTMDNVQ